MNRCVALLRGINVGKAKRVAMADLRRMVEELGYTEVATLLNSGNVVFTVRRAAPGDPATRIEEALQRQLGVVSKVQVLEAAALARVVKANKLHRLTDNDSRLMVTFFSTAADRRLLTPLTRQDWAPEALALAPGAAFQWCPQGVIHSPLAQAVGKALGDRATTRNWATVQKLHALLNEAPREQ